METTQAHGQVHKLARGQLPQRILAERLPAFGLGLPFLALRGEVECFEDTGAVSFEQGLGVAPWVHTDRDTKTLDDAFALHWNGSRKPWDLDRCDEETRPYFLRYLARSPGLYGGHVAESHGDYYAKCAPPPPRPSHHRFLADRARAPRRRRSRDSAFASWDQAYAWYANVYKFTPPRDITEGYTEADWPSMAITIDECEMHCADLFPSGRGVLACVEIKFYGALVLKHRVVLHAIDAHPKTEAWRCNHSARRLDGTSAAARAAPAPGCFPRRMPRVPQDRAGAHIPGLGGTRADAATGDIEEGGRLDFQRRRDRPFDGCPRGAGTVGDGTAGDAGDAPASLGFTPDNGRMRHRGAVRGARGERLGHRGEDVAQGRVYEKTDRWKTRRHQLARRLHRRQGLRHRGVRFAPRRRSRRTDITRRPVSSERV